MEKISGFQILSLSMSGFKCFAEQQDFEFGSVTMISGANHAGKSSIADAIAFAVTGTTFFGEVRIFAVHCSAQANPSFLMTESCLSAL